MEKGTLAQGVDNTFCTKSPFLLLQALANVYTIDKIDRMTIISTSSETFEKCSVSFKFKKGENFKHRNTLEYFEY